MTDETAEPEPETTNGEETDGHGADQPAEDAGDPTKFGEPGHPAPVVPPQPEAEGTDEDEDEEEDSDDE
jgi:hypothetical protein